MQMSHVTNTFRVFYFVFCVGFDVIDSDGNCIRRGKLIQNCPVGHLCALCFLVMHKYLFVGSSTAENFLKSLACRMVAAGSTMRRYSGDQGECPHPNCGVKSRALKV